MPGEALLVPKDNISVVSLPRLSTALKLHDLFHNMIGIIMLVVMVLGSGSPHVKPAAWRTRHAIQMTRYAHSPFDHWLRMRNANLKIHGPCVSNWRGCIYVYMIHMIVVMMLSDIFANTSVTKNHICVPYSLCHTFSS
jgi:hypothetical protein